MTGERSKENFIRERFSYCPDTGVLTWTSGRLVGKTAGYFHAGYYYVTVCGSGGRAVAVHRVAWFLTYGKWPENQIDHVNGDQLDNRICNLRDIPHRGNQQNVTKRRDNTSGFVGVTHHGNKWKAQINHRGEKHYLGLYDTPEDAAASYELAKWSLHEYQPTERGFAHVST